MIRSCTLLPEESLCPGEIIREKKAFTECNVRKNVKRSLILHTILCFPKNCGIVSDLVGIGFEKSFTLCHFQPTKIDGICGAIVPLLNGVGAAAVTFLGLDPRTRDPSERARMQRKQRTDGRALHSPPTNESFKVAKFSVGGHSVFRGKVVFYLCG